MALYRSARASVGRASLAGGLRSPLRSVDRTVFRNGQRVWGQARSTPVEILTAILTGAECLFTDLIRRRGRMSEPGPALGRVRSGAVRAAGGEIDHAS